MIIPPFQTVPPGTPQVPLKNSRLIVTDADLATARFNIKEYSEARKVLEAIQEAARPWLEWNDEDLHKLLTSARVPRAFDLNPTGCPVHGDEVFNKGGHYPWIIDPRHPLQVTCPVGGETYPTNDYEAYVQSGFSEKIGWDTPYIDDGFGWVAPDGERYWFVAYANHWNWYHTIMPAILNLSRSFALTGDKASAHRAALMLHRLAEVYPEMDHENQSRYGLMMKQQGVRYPGKVLNRIWETGFARDFAAAYDAVWETIDGDIALQNFLDKTGREIRAFIEANLLEDAIDAYAERKIQGNYGMHQSALLHILLSRQHVDIEKYIHMLVDEPGESYAHTGLRYALYNQVWRDGAPYESPGYNWTWIANIAELSELLKKGGHDLFQEPKMKLLFNSPLEQANIGRYTPSVGDSGNVLAMLHGHDAAVYASAQRAYDDARYASWIASAGEADSRGFTTYETLFNQALPESAAAPHGRAIAPQPSRLLAGFGMGILNNPADTISLAMTYGIHVSHFHYDFLNFDLFANGQSMMPDLGYPDAMNAYVSSIFTWSSNTIAHNTVVVDAQKQTQNRPGTLHEFASSPFARSIAASSPAYEGVKEYRRHLIQVDVDAETSYVLDVFRVQGGKQHDYSLHGPPGELEAVDGTWSTPAPGTFAGANVQLGEIYDDPVLAAKDYNGSYQNYQGSGFQHLFNVQKLEAGSGTLHFRHTRDTNAQLKIHPLTQEMQQTGASECFMADAYDLPRGRNYTLKYMITRRSADGHEPLKSTFVSVLEPFSSEPYIQGITLLTLDAGSGVVVRVQRGGCSDIILSDPQLSRKALAAYSIETDARTAVVTFDAQNRPQRVFFSGGTFLKCKDESFAAAPLRGTISAIDAMAQTLEMTLPATSTLDANALAKRVAHCTNALRQTVHPIESASRSGDVLTLKTADAILAGRARVKSAQGVAVVTDTPFPFALTYEGATLLDADFEPLATVKTVADGIITLAAAPAVPIVAGNDVWFANIGLGEEVAFPTLYYWMKEN